MIAATMPEANAGVTTLNGNMKPVTVVATAVMMNQFVQVDVRRPSNKLRMVGIPRNRAMRLIAV